MGSQYAILNTFHPIDPVDWKLWKPVEIKMNFCGFEQCLAAQRESVMAAEEFKGRVTIDVGQVVGIRRPAVLKLRWLDVHVAVDAHCVFVLVAAKLSCHHFRQR